MTLPARNKTAPAPRGVFARALARLKADHVPESAVRIGLIIDATGSRSASWAEAQSIQARMFFALAATKVMALRLVHFGGCNVTDHGWETDAKKLAARMGRVHCRAGGTQILPALGLFLKDPAPRRARALIVVGDAFEESEARAHRTGRALAAAGIKVFSFLEGEDPAATKAFQTLAAQTGGRFARFGADLPLGDLCEGAALYAAGGEQAAARVKNEKVRLLLRGGGP